MLRRVLLMVIIAAGIGLAVFSPKPLRVGGFAGGPIVPGDSAYRETYRCLGYASRTSSCFGIRVSRVCQQERFTLDEQGRTAVLLVTVPCQTAWDQ